MADETVKCEIKACLIYKQVAYEITRTTPYIDYNYLYLVMANASSIQMLNAASSL